MRDKILQIQSDYFNCEPLEKREMKTLENGLKEALSSLLVQYQGEGGGNTSSLPATKPKIKSREVWRWEVSETQ